MDEQHHDLVLAVTNHLPHLIAYNIVGTSRTRPGEGPPGRPKVMKYSAGGASATSPASLRRVRPGDVARHVFLTNKDAVLEILGRFLQDLHGLSRHIRSGDGEALQELFTPPARHPPGYHRRRGRETA